MSKYERLYRDADKYVIYNDNDPDLTPFVISLPAPPKDTTIIEGFGKHPDDQMFTPLEIPYKIQKIEGRAIQSLREKHTSNSQKSPTRYKIIEEFWKIFDEEQDDLEEEIKWVKRVHWHLYNGQWIYIDGKPTWIPPWYFNYLNFWFMPSTQTSKPDYRDIDRRMYIFKHYMWTGTETFLYTDKEGRAIKTNGVYEMIDTGNRVFLGYGKAKRRREGATNMACSDNVLISCSGAQRHSDIVADTGSGAKDIFDEILVPGWNNMPVFLEPINDSTSNPSEIKLTTPRNVIRVKSFGSIIGFTDTAGERGNDKRKLYSIVHDEVGKTKEHVANTRERWEINKLTLAQYDKIHGFAHHISTVEDMSGGGSVFEEFMNQSDIYTRMPNGQTISGCVMVFFHGYDGLDGFIGAHGESIIEKPTKRQIRLAPKGSKFAKVEQGARDYLRANLDFLLKRGTPQDLITYRERLRKTPINYADCWIGTSGDMGWDVLPIDRRIIEIKRNDHRRTADLYWINGTDFTQGVRLEFNEDGRFIFSESFLNKQNPSKPVYSHDMFDINRNTYVKTFMPLNPIGCIGIDPFKWGNRTEAKYNEGGSSRSDGGAVGYWNYDSMIDGGVPSHAWQSERVIFTYKNRGTQIQFHEDMAKAAVYCNMACNVERNVGDTVKYFLEIGLYGYLLRMPKKDGSLNEEPGSYLQDKTPLFEAIKQYYERTINREEHAEILQDMKDIKGVEQLTKYDRLAALGHAIMGARSMGYLRSIGDVNDDGYDIDLSGTEYGLRDW